MKMMKTICWGIGVLLFLNTNAQQWETGLLMRTDPFSIITSHYLKVGNCDNSLYQEFDVKNPYTYLQLMNDEKGKTYHLLYQTDFSENLTFAAVSNNINQSCFQIRKAATCGCIKKMQEETFSSLQTSGMLQCVKETMMTCAE